MDDILDVKQGSDLTVLIVFNEKNVSNIMVERGAVL